MKQKRNLKQMAIDALNQAKAASLKEQDSYRDIIEKNVASGLSGPRNPELNTLGWKGVLALMKDCCYPPSPGEREKKLKIDFDQTLSRIKLQSIPDTDIRATTYFLNELVEHTQRLRSIAVFIDRVGHLHGFGASVFSYWAERSSLEIIYAEALQMGKTEEAESISLFIKALDIIAVTYVEIWGKPVEEEALRTRLAEVGTYRDCTIQ